MKRHDGGVREVRRDPAEPGSLRGAVPNLRDWLKQWEDAGRPAPAAYTPALVRTGDGWDLRLSR
ncbi:hypothetical protein ACFYPK_28490 [Streptomyces halstedii]|uniref:hypothetical protein n=1 Tax=Streptomyces halstedii TaxID=1944 RepID=UPI00345FDFC7